MSETFIEVSGKTEDEAIQKALAQIGLERDEVSVEILERAKPGFLGLGGAPARIKVSYMSNTPEVSPPAQNTAPAVEASPPVRQTVSSAPAETGAEDVSKRAQVFLTGLLERMGTPATLHIQEEGDTLRIELVGENMGAVIGRRGETLDAIQHLTNYAMNSGSDKKRVRIFLDAENYRKKREETLVRLANKMAEKVVRYRKNMALEPMNAYERHIIHTALQDVAQVSTYSAGTEPNRRVFVAYERSATTPSSDSNKSTTTSREWA